MVPLAAPPNQGGHKLPHEYEAALVDALREHVSVGDETVVIGGGIGVTATVAAQEAGDTGQVIVYEGAIEMVEQTEETLRLNSVAQRVTVNHTVVSHAERLDGTRGNGNTLAPNLLPPCDILEMDCEGAEVEILRDMVISPQTLIVETHGNLEIVKSLIRKSGYVISSQRLAERGPYEDMCKENDVYVLVARFTGA